MINELARHRRKRPCPKLKCYCSICLDRQGKISKHRNFTVANKVNNLEVIAEKTQYLFMSREQTAAQNHKEKSQ
jgi:hypothetical protein